jgi:hypothetical protein
MYRPSVIELMLLTMPLTNVAIVALLALLAG